MKDNNVILTMDYTDFRLHRVSTFNRTENHKILYKNERCNSLRYSGQNKLAGGVPQYYAVNPISAEASSLELYN